MLSTPTLLETLGVIGSELRSEVVNNVQLQCQDRWSRQWLSVLESSWAMSLSQVTHYMLLLKLVVHFLELFEGNLIASLLVGCVQRLQ